MSALKCPQCGLINFAAATQCKRCGTLFSQNVSTESGANLKGFVLEDGYVLPPPPTVGLPGAGGIWRDVKTLVMSKDAVLPDRCVKCNAVTTGRLKRKLSWHNPLLYLILFAPLIYAIVATVLRKRATIELGLCEEHKAQRRTFILISLLLVLGGVAGFVLAIIAEDGTPAFIGLLLLVTAIIFGVRSTRLVYPKKIDDRFVWLRGVNADYLDQLPPWPGF